LDALPAGASVGTSSRRRAAQLLHRRPDLKIIDIRGNVPTRIAKALDPDGPYDALVLARAGLERLNLLGNVTDELSLGVMLPAPGQGALAIHCRDEVESLVLLQPLTHTATWAPVTAVRAVLDGLGGGCSTPVAAYGRVQGGDVHLRGRVIAVDGGRVIEVSGSADVRSARQLGLELAQQALDQGADTLLNA